MLYFELLMSYRKSHREWNWQHWCLYIFQNFQGSATWKLGHRSTTTYVSFSRLYRKSKVFLFNIKGTFFSDKRRGAEEMLWWYYSLCIFTHRNGHQHMAGTIFPSTSRHQDSDGWQPRLYYFFRFLFPLLFSKKVVQTSAIRFPTSFPETRGSDVNFT